MRFARFATALALSAAACLPASAGVVYTYTGNLFTVDMLNPTPARTIATLEFDIPEHFTGTAQEYGGAQMTAGTVTTGNLTFNIAPNGYHIYNVEFLDGEITGWFLLGGEGNYLVNSMSANYKHYSTGAADAVYDVAGMNNGVKMFVNDNPGSWTHAAAADVPEPETAFLLGAGAIMLGIARRKQKQAS